MLKRVIYHKDGKRMTKDFTVRGSKRPDGLHINKDDEVAALEFIKTVDYKGSVYLEEEYDKSA